MGKKITLEESLKMHYTGISKEEYKRLYRNFESTLKKNKISLSEDQITKRVDRMAKKIARKRKRRKNSKKVISIFAVFLLIITIGFSFYFLKPVSLSSHGAFDVCEFIEVQIPRSYKATSLMDAKEYDIYSDAIVFSSKKADLLFNVTDNVDMLTESEIANELAYDFKDNLNLDQVEQSTILSADEIEIPILNFQLETIEGPRYIQYAIVNSGYKTILISMNSYNNEFKAFNKIISSLELV